MIMSIHTQINYYQKQAFREFLVSLALNSNLNAHFPMLLTYVL